MRDDRVESGLALRHPAQAPFPEAPGLSAPPPAPRLLGNVSRFPIPSLLSRAVPPSSLPSPSCRRAVLSQARSCHLAMTFGCHNLKDGEVLLASSGYRSGMLLTFYDVQDSLA